MINIRLLNSMINIIKFNINNKKPNKFKNGDFGLDSSPQSSNP